MFDGRLPGGPPKAIGKPASADSLAGVLARLFPQLVDSAAVDRIQWRQSPELKVGTAPADVYQYRTNEPQDRFTMVPLIAKAERDHGIPFVTFAARNWPNPNGSWAEDPEVVKHEMFHAMSNNKKDWRHDPSRSPLFRTLEDYRGR